MKFFNKKSSLSKKRNSSLAIGSSLPPIEQYQLGRSDTEGSLEEEDYVTKLNTLRNSTISNEAKSILRKSSRSQLRDNDLSSSISASNVSNAAAAAALNKSNSIRRGQRASYQSGNYGRYSADNRCSSLQNVPRKLPESLINNGRTSSFTNVNEHSLRNKGARRTSSLTNSRLPIQENKYMSPKRSAARSNSLNYSPTNKRTSSINSNTLLGNQKSMSSSGRNMSITSMLTNNSLDMSDMTIQSTTQKKGNTVIRQTKIIDSHGVTKRIITKTIKKVGAYEVVNSNVVNLSANEAASPDFGVDDAILNELAELDEMEEDYESLMLGRDTSNSALNDFNHHFDGFDQPMILPQSPQRSVQLENHLIDTLNGDDHFYESSSEIASDKQAPPNASLSPPKTKHNNNNCEIIEDTIMEEDENEVKATAEDDHTTSENTKGVHVVDTEASLADNADLITPSDLSEETNVSTNSQNKESSQSSNILEPTDDDEATKSSEKIENSHPFANINKLEIKKSQELRSLEKPVVSLATSPKSGSSIESGDVVFFDAPSSEAVQNNVINKKQQYLANSVAVDTKKSKHAPMRSSMRNYSSPQAKNSSRFVTRQKSSSNFSLANSDVASIRSGRSRVSFRGGVEVIDKKSSAPAPKLTEEEMYQSALRVAHQKVYGSKYPETSEKVLSGSATKLSDENQESTTTLGNKASSALDLARNDVSMQTIQSSDKENRSKPKKIRWFNRLFKL